MTRVVVLAAVACTAMGVSLTARSASLLDLSMLLDRYAAGQFDEAVRAVEDAGDLQAQQLRPQWKTTGVAWVDARRADRSQRLLTVATFVLEVEHVRTERGDWNSPVVSTCVEDPKRPEKLLPGGCYIEWAQSLLVARGPADDAERTWVLAAASLASGARDWRFLYRATPTAKPPVRGLIADALVRFPDDPRIRLERAIANSSRYFVTTDGGGLAPGAMTIINNLRAPQIDALRARYDPRQSAIEDLTALAADRDEQLAAEARLRLGYLLWALGDQDRARAELQAAAETATDRDLKYLARFLLGWVALNANRPADAIPHLEAALEIRPGSQSAVLALAALELQRGEASRAHEIAQSSLRTLPADDDPWRLFLYGHYPRLTALLAELRRKVHP